MGIADMDDDRSSYYSNYEHSEQYGIDNGLFKEWEDRIARGEKLGKGFDQSQQNLYNSATARLNANEDFKKRTQLDTWNADLNFSLAEKPVPLPQIPPEESKVDTVAGKSPEKELYNTTDIVIPDLNNSLLTAKPPQSKINIVDAILEKIIPSQQPLISEIDWLPKFQTPFTAEVIIGGYRKVKATVGWDYAAGLGQGLAGYQGVYNDRSSEYKFGWDVGNKSMKTLIEVAPIIEGMPLKPGGAPALQLAAGGGVARVATEVPLVPIFFSVGDNGSKQQEQNSNTSNSKGASTADKKVAKLDKDELVVADKSFLDAEGRIDWDKHAPNAGYVEGTRVDGARLDVGTVIDRYGSPRGRYTSPVGTSFENRALPYIENPNAYHQYKVIKPIENVSMGEIAPAFKQLGGGIQYELPNSVEYLIENKYLEVIN